jgi:hypothetical protein
MRLTDHSQLRPEPGQANVEVPLNGEMYYARPEVPVETVLTAVGSAAPMEQLTAQLDAAGITDIKDEEALKRLQDNNPLLAMRIGTMGMGRVDRAIAFMQEALLPESLQLWAANMRPLPPVAEGATPEMITAHRWAAEEHAKKMITVPQLLAVYQDLLAYYNARPTEPSSSSQAGGDGTTGTSMASPQPVAARTPWTLPPTVTSTSPTTPGPQG